MIDEAEVRPELVARLVEEAGDAHAEALAAASYDELRIWALVHEVDGARLMRRLDRLQARVDRSPPISPRRRSRSAEAPMRAGGIVRLETRCRSGRCARRDAELLERVRALVPGAVVSSDIATPRPRAYAWGDEE